MANPFDDDLTMTLCPQCGFDLRGTESDRCGECGLEIDREGLRTSGIPWVYRRRIGRIRAYFKTVWLFLADRRGVQFEAAKPQDPADGRAFARVTGSLLAVALLVAFGASVLAAEGLSFLAIQPEDLLSALGLGSPAYDARVVDAAVPWSAGATLWPVPPLCLIGLALYVAGAQRFVFRARSAPPELQARTLALSWYTSAPLVLLVPALGCWFVAGVLTQGKPFSDWRPSKDLSFGLAPLGALFYLVGVLATLRRTGQWLARTRHCGSALASLGALELIGLWVLGWVFFLGLVPWSVGFARIVIDSLR
jgi:hypothetical protein